MKKIIVATYAEAITLVQQLQADGWDSTWNFKGTHYIVMAS
jgi:hypothetical protein